LNEILNISLSLSLSLSFSLSLIHICEEGKENKRKKEDKEMNLKGHLFWRNKLIPLKEKTEDTVDWKFSKV
jgi:hypothetical protein